MTTATACPDLQHIPDRSVVLHVDRAASQQTARAWASEQAAADHRPLVLVAMAPPAAATALSRQRDLEALEAYVEASAASVLERHPDLDVHAVVTDMDPAPTLAQVSETASLLVVGAHTRGLAALAKSWGIDAWLSARTRCPLVVVPGHGHSRVRRGVLVGIDLTERSGDVLEFAFRYADQHGLPLTVMTCTAAEAQHEVSRLRLSEVTAGFRERFPDVHLTRVLEQGRPSHVLVRAAEAMNLLVVGRHQRSASMLGHVRGGVVDRAACPVAVIPVSA